MRCAASDVMVRRWWRDSDTSTRMDPWPSSPIPCRGRRPTESRGVPSCRCAGRPTSSCWLLRAAKRQDVIVATAGESSSQAYLAEVHLEHELSVAARSSRYAAGKAIEVARALATTFPGSGAALATGEVSELYCRILVEKTRVVADETVLAEIERRVLPKAKRLAPGEFGGEVAKAVARLDRDATQRAKNARATRRVWTRHRDRRRPTGPRRDRPRRTEKAPAVSATGSGSCFPARIRGDRCVMRGSGQGSVREPLDPPAPTCRPHSHHSEPPERQTGRMATGDEGFRRSISADSETSGTITDQTKSVSLTLLGGLVVCRRWASGDGQCPSEPMWR